MKKKKDNMKELGFSDIGDLSDLGKDLQKVFEEYFPNKKVAFGFAFTLFPHYNDVHWATNIDRHTGIMLFREVAQKMESKLN